MSKKSVDFLKNELNICEKYLNNKNAYDAVPKERDTNIPLCYKKLAIIYRFFSNESKTKKFFHHLTTIGFGLSTSRFDVEGLREEDKNNIRLLCSIGRGQLEKGIQFNLAQTDPQKATQLFEWAAENCYQSDEDIAAGIKYELYDEIAVGFLWRGYALLNLEKYEEAYELLKEVIPYFNKWKKSGGEVWQKVEYALPKALVPLCEYKLDPTPENLQKAQSSIEDYIKSLRDNKDKLEGYLYYFHLKETYPEVYSAEVAEIPAKKRPKKKKTVKKLDLPPSESDTEGSVVVFDIKGGYLDVFGTNNELEEYAEKVEELGEYPVLAGLMELYAMEAEEEPGPIIEECERLLASPDADSFLKEKTKILLQAALDAKSEGGTIMLYFDAEVYDC